MKIIRTDSENTDFKALARLLDQHFRMVYGNVQDQFDQYNEAVIQAIETALVIYVDGKATGIGCFINYAPGVGEVKRVFVLPEFRGQGLAFQLMEALESWARELNYQSLILETGVHEAAAIRLYEKLGYRQIDNYGFYKEVPVSICFGKELTAEY